MTHANFTPRCVPITLVAAALTLAVCAAPAAHGVGTGLTQTTLVNAVPSTASPNITDGTVYALTKVGNTIVVGGDFTGVQNRGSSTTLARSGILAFNATTGTVSTTFAPTLDGTVEALAPGPVPNTVYAGGYFNTVNGVPSKGVTLLSTVSGAVSSGFAPAALDGAVFTLARAGAHLIIGGSFTHVGSATEDGLASLNSTTGALDSYVDIALLGHHNYTGGSGAQGPVGARALAINHAGTRMVVIGNFRTAAGLARDQIAVVDLTGTAATVDPNWATQKFTAACASASFDTYVTDVQYAPNGTYFAVTATGGSSTANTDGSRSLCDSASRWNAADTGTDVAPAWIDYTGNDTLLSVAATGTAVYVGGHQRWLNNPDAFDSAGPGAVPRPGLAALDPLDGLPLAWNPGRNPRGAGAYALLVTGSGLYVGSDTDYFGNYAYLRQKIGYFPLAGGTAPASTKVSALPADVYLAGPLAGQNGLTSSDIAYRAVSGTTIGPTTQLTTGPNWANTRGAFVVGSTVFYGLPNGNFYRASFDGATLGTPTAIDPYDDPKWDGVATGSGQTYQGVPSGYLSELTDVTGAFYAGGRLFYTLKGQPSLYWRWFSPDSGTVGAAENVLTGADFSTVNGITASGTRLYYAQTDGTLRSMSYAGLTLQPSTATLVSGPAKDGLNWQARNLFLYG